MPPHSSQYSVFIGLRILQKVCGKWYLTQWLTMAQKFLKIHEKLYKNIKLCHVKITLSCNSIFHQFVISLVIFVIQPKYDDKLNFWGPDSNANQVLLATTLGRKQQLQKTIINVRQDPEQGRQRRGTLQWRQPSRRVESSRVLGQNSDQYFLWHCHQFRKK